MCPCCPIGIDAPGNNRTYLLTYMHYPQAAATTASVHRNHQDFTAHNTVDALPTVIWSCSSDRQVITCKSTLSLSSRHDARLEQLTNLANPFHRKCQNATRGIFNCNICGKGSPIIFHPTYAVPVPLTFLYGSSTVEVKLKLKSRLV